MITHLIVSFVYLLLFGKARTSHDYTVYTDITRTFSEAEIFCRSQGQSLALIKTNDDLDNLKKIIANSFLFLDNDMFIGLQFDTSSSKFVWLDGDTLTLNTNWDVSIGEPNCHIQQCDGVYSYCVRITKITYLFRTVNCDRKYYTLCTEIVGETTVPDSTSAGYSELTTISTGYSELTIKSAGYSELTTKSAGYSELTTKPAVYTPPLPYCSCSYCGSNSGVMAVVLSGNFTLEEIRQIVVDDFNRNIKPYISISKYDLSKTRRSRTSAPDPRWSSTYIGIFSACLISVPIIIMVVIDLSNLCQR